VLLVVADCVMLSHVYNMLHISCVRNILLTQPGGEQPPHTML
jgi:hypothetical protein